MDIAKLKVREAKWGQISNALRKLYDISEDGRVKIDIFSYVNELCRCGILVDENDKAVEVNLNDLSIDEAMAVIEKIVEKYPLTRFVRLAEKIVGVGG